MFHKNRNFLWFSCIVCTVQYNTEALSSPNFSLPVLFSQNRWNDYTVVYTQLLSWKLCLPVGAVTLQVVIKISNIYCWTSVNSTWTDDVFM